ncbi:3-hydroxy-9,10-secoandrosta-1,3,5(10)-triene-9,17-dione monooxygenase reductase component [Collimonas sp. OK607]|uniref:flavin reductase family protein n=1 Tax=Collimonas sp. OK607 TaxID=1798194 RepID=UPI0008E12F94|nr:flavin reductase family protein [Collimonas sp. OK607]SFA82401.1 3-hydroxy-9,10-secoandrosta-1,3,5(10)-triene-9,17-dione monooxygenase reductase component [Collimonas sp. OK607]
MANPSEFDPKDFRNALSMFATGVTIVTTRAEDGAAVGMTANSFNSVSLQPPMVLWSLAKNARSLPVFANAPFWNVHILSNDQDALSNRFARAGEDKFAGLELDECPSNMPLIRGCSARFQCRTAFQYEGGDHIIFVGEVIGYDRTDTPPLLYVTGQYAVAAHKSGLIATAPAETGVRPEAASGPDPYSEDMLGYLLGRAHYQFMARFRPALKRLHISDAEFFLLSLLSVRQPLSAADVASHMAYTGCEFDLPALQAACARDLLVSHGESQDMFSLSPAGTETILHILAAAKAVEADLIGNMGQLQSIALRNLLKTMLTASDPGLPKLWTAPAP